jgi:uncharacterized membrane protein (DUF485 family)
MTIDPIPSDQAALAHLDALRWRMALALTGIMTATYFGFVLLVAFDKPLLQTTIAPGLSIGILLGVLMVLIVWTLTAVYVVWANRRYDHRVRALRGPQ